MAAPAPARAAYIGPMHLPASQPRFRKPASLLRPVRVLPPSLHLDAPAPGTRRLPVVFEPRLAWLAPRVFGMVLSISVPRPHLSTLRGFTKSVAPKVPSVPACPRCSGPSRAGTCAGSGWWTETKRCSASAPPATHGEAQQGPPQSAKPRRLATKAAARCIPCQRKVHACCLIAGRNCQPCKGGAAGSGRARCEQPSAGQSRNFCMTHALPRPDLPHALASPLTTPTPHTSTHVTTPPP